METQRVAGEITRGYAGLKQFAVKYKLMEWCFGVYQVQMIHRKL